MLRQQVLELLNQLPDAGILREIHEGREVPPLTDYHLLAMPDNWNAPPPTEYVGGRTLIPVFKGGDTYTIYCIDPATNEFLALDVEAPWPPVVTFASCREFKEHIFRIVSEEKSEQAKSTLRELLGL